MLEKPLSGSAFQDDEEVSTGSAKDEGSLVWFERGRIAVFRESASASGATTGYHCGRSLKRGCERREGSRLAETCNCGLRYDVGYIFAVRMSFQNAN